MTEEEPKRDITITITLTSTVISLIYGIMHTVITLGMC